MYFRYNLPDSITSNRGLQQNKWSAHFYKVQSHNSVTFQCKLLRNHLQNSAITYGSSLLVFVLPVIFINHRSITYTYTPHPPEVYSLFEQHSFITNNRSTLADSFYININIIVKFVSSKNRPDKDCNLYFWI